MAGRQGSSANAAAAEFVPVYEWHDGDGNYLLRLNLPGFKKEDFRVQVDTTGRLTVIGQRRPADGGGAGIVRLHKVFQLPPNSNLDEITGRFDGSVLSLTVPKLLPPGTVELLAPQGAKEETGEDVAEKPPADQKSKVGREAERLIEATRAGLAGRKREEVKEQTGGNGKKKPPAKKVSEEQEDAKPEPAVPSQKVPQRDDQEEKRKVAEHKANVEREAERRIEAARVRLAMEREAETEKKGSWKERAEGEGLKLAEAIGNNKEVIATAVAAAAIGLFVYHKLFSRN